MLTRVKVLPVILSCVFFLTVLLGGIKGISEPRIAYAAEDPDEWKNYYAIGWQGISSAEILSGLGIVAGYEDHYKVARAIGAKYVFHGHPQDSSVYDQYKKDFKFYYNDAYKVIWPEVEGITLSQSVLDYCKANWPYEFDSYPNLPRVFHQAHWDAIKAYNVNIYNAYKATWEKYCAWQSTAPFPNNLCPLQLSSVGKGSSSAPKGTIFLPDFQQQTVQELWADTIVNWIKNKSEKPSQNYLFAGYTIDMIDLWQEINLSDGLLGENDSSLLHGGITHQYSNIKLGWFNFLYKLRTETEAAFPDRPIRMIYDPSAMMYNTWVSKVKNCAEISSTVKAKIVGDHISSEQADLLFLNDQNLFSTGWFTNNNVGSQSPDINEASCDYVKHKSYLGNIAVKGSWFNMYGQWDRNINRRESDIPKDSMLARFAANWDNINHVPLADRSYSGGVYSSTLSYADDNVIYTHNPDGQRVFVHFRNNGRAVMLRSNETVTAVRTVNGLLQETGDGSSLVNIAGNTVTLKSNTPTTLIFYTTMSGGGSDITVDNGSSTVTYSGTGWIHSSNDSDYYGGTKSVSKTANDDAKFTFTGSKIAVYGKKGAFNGKFDVYVDGTYDGTGDTYSSGTQNMVKLYEVSGLSTNRAHTISVRVNGQKNGSSQDYYVGLDFFRVTPAMDKVDDSSPTVAYSGTGWAQSGDGSFYNSTKSVSSVTNDEAEFTFTGKSIAIYGKKGAFNGKFDVYVDGAFNGTADTYSSTTINQTKLYLVEGLSTDRAHTVKIKLNGQKNSAAMDYYIGLDYFEYK